jgi:uncharacterized hydrophobic protein (TIGR00271 family)
MSILGFIPDPEAAATVVAWVRALGVDDEESTLLCYETGFHGRTAEAVREALGEEGAGDATLIAVDTPMPVAEVLGHLRNGNMRLLVSGPFALPKARGKVQTSDELMRSSPCQTFVPQYGDVAPDEAKGILFVATGRMNDRSALHLVDGLRQRLGVRVTIGWVEEVLTGTKAEQFGKSYIQALLHELSLEEEQFEIKVVLDRLRHRGIVQLVENHDLIVTGMDAASLVRPLRDSLGDTTVSLVKRTRPLRLQGIAARLPRINPADHAELLYTLRMGSDWGPDFIGMLALAAAIASLGLLQNSAAVVIGSMLLAPLMTPMIGLGLALGQANRPLALLCGKSIGLGFLLTLGVSYLVTVVIPTGETLSGEVLARGVPNVLDLLIAVFAAAAATFALARPNIVGAIAGVAIATALVPPVCAIGISLGHAEMLNAVGASALFFTNLVAIIVTSTFTLSFLGVTAERAPPRERRRAFLTRMSLVALVVVLVGPLSTTLLSQIDEGKSVPAAHPVTRAVHGAVFERVAQDEAVEVMFLARPRAENRVLIHIASDNELPPSYAKDLRKIVRDKMEDPELQVSVVAVRGYWRSDTDSPADEPE